MRKRNFIVKTRIHTYDLKTMKNIIGLAGVTDQIVFFFISVQNLYENNVYN